MIRKGEIMAKKQQDNWSNGVAISGATLVGLGIGLVFDQAGAGVLIGVGAGFLLMMIMNASRK